MLLNNPLMLAPNPSPSSEGPGDRLLRIGKSPSSSPSRKDKNFADDLQQCMACCCQPHQTQPVQPPDQEKTAVIAASVVMTPTSTTLSLAMLSVGQGESATLQLGGSTPNLLANLTVGEGTAGLNANNNLPTLTDFAAMLADQGKGLNPSNLSALAPGEALPQGFHFQPEQPLVNPLTALADPQTAEIAGTLQTGPQLGPSGGVVGSMPAETAVVGSGMPGQTELGRFAPPVTHTAAALKPVPPTQAGLGPDLPVNGKNLQFAAAVESLQVARLEVAAAGHQAHLVDGLTNGPSQNGRGHDHLDEAGADAAAAASRAPAPPHLAQANQGTGPADQVATAIHERHDTIIQQGRTEIHLRLEPPELGTVRIHLSVSDDKITARIVVHEEVARQMIEGQMQHLRQRLEEAGIALGQFSVAHDGSGSRERPRHQAHDPDAIDPVVSANRRSRAGPRPTGPPSSSSVRLDMIV